MIFIAGAGAMADAANAMRQIQRNMRRQRRRMQRRTNLKADRYQDYQAERADFDCVYLCATCGYFVDDPSDSPPDSPHGSPENTPDDAPVESSKIPCAACGDVEWIDLGFEPVADRVRDMETKERMKPPKFVTRLVVFGSLAVFGAIMAWLVMSTVSETGEVFTPADFDYVMITAIAAIFFVPLAYYFLPRPLSLLLLRGKERTPDRWHVPLNLPDPDRNETRRLENLEAQPLDETITAPISGRECIAYQLSILFDTPGDARPPEWVLQEQRAVAARLGDELELAPAAFYLESPEEQVDAPGARPASQLLEGDESVDGDDGDDGDDERYDEVKKFLRQRGLFISDGDFHFYEAVLEPGDCVRAADYDGELYVLTHSDAR